MTLHAFLTLKAGGSQVTGSSRFKNRDGQIVVSGLRHEITTVRNDQGHPTGKPKHRVLVLHKSIDRASPILHQAFANNVVFSEFLLELQRMPPVGGGAESYCMIGVDSAQIAWIRSAMPNARKTENQPLPEFEEVAFTYRHISWKYFGAGDGSESGDGNFTEQDADFTADEAHWSVALQKTLQERLKQAGTAAGATAKQVFLELLAKPPQEGGK